MKNYVIVTDSGSDISPDILHEWNVELVPLSFKFSDSDKEYRDGELDTKSFYERMRGGATSKTSAVNSADFRKKFEEILDTGKDILYLGFSSALSATFNSGRVAAAELTRERPGIKIVCIDTRSASAGLGLTVYLTSEMKRGGKSLEEAAKYAESLSKNLCHWFTVDDLVYLKRGGRVSPTAAFFGNMLGIKPVLYMDSSGHLKSYSKARGRRGAIEALVQKYGELALDKSNGTVFISHGDCLGDAKLLEKLLAETYGARVKHIANVGSVIGSHSGPGTLALFFIGKTR